MSDTTEQPKAKTKPKGTKITETIIGAASNKYVTVTKGLKDAVAEAMKMTDLMDQNALKISDQEEKLANLQMDFQNKRTQNNIDLDLAYKADQKAFAEKYLSENNLRAVNAQEYTKLEESILEWESKFEDKVKEETSRAYSQAKKAEESAKQLADAEYRAKEATNLAKIQNLEAQLAFATKQSTSWENQLNAERQASIERGKNQTTNVNIPASGK